MADVPSKDELFVCIARLGRVVVMSTTLVSGSTAFVLLYDLVLSLSDSLLLGLISRRGIRNSPFFLGLGVAKQTFPLVLTKPIEPIKPMWLIFDPCILILESSNFAINFARRFSEGLVAYPADSHRH